MPDMNNARTSWFIHLRSQVHKLCSIRRIAQVEFEWGGLTIRCRQDYELDVSVNRSPAVALEEMLLPIRWGISIISAGTLLLAGSQRIEFFFGLILGWAIYTLAIEWYIEHGRHVDHAVQVLPLVDGLFAVTALLTVGGTLNPFTPLFSLTLASIAMRLPSKRSIPLGIALLGILALGLYVVPDHNMLDNSFFSFASFTLLIMWLVRHLARNADRFRVSLDDLNSLLHHFPCGVIVEDERGLYANEYLLRSLELPVPEIMGTSVLDHYQNQRLEQVWNELQQGTPDPSDGDEIGQIAEVSVRLGGGVSRTYVCRRMLLTLTSGAKSHVATLIDITEQIDMQRRLQEQERLRLIGTLTAMAIHEVRNPLAAVRATAQLISFDKSSPATREHAIRITAIVDQLHTFLDRLMDLGRMPVDPVSRCEAGTLLREVITLLTPLAHRKNVIIRIEDQVTDLEVTGDPHSLRQVLINLVQNGIDAMPRGGTVTIRAEQVGTNVHFTVRDEGEGIPPEVGARIFDPFYTTKETGTGLGLAISRQIIEEHNGRLWFEARSQGTTFHIQLPGTQVSDVLLETS